MDTMLTFGINLKMIDATLLEQVVTPEKQKEFLLAMDGQLNKLDFLMQSMIKTSRLEAGVIALEPKPQMIYDTLRLDWHCRKCF